MWRWAVTGLLLCALTSGCSSETNGDSPSREAVSASGTFVARFEPQPDPPVVGENALTLWLADDQERAVTGAALGLQAWMPAHGHGSSGAPMVVEKGDGEYRAEHLYYSMPGRWEIRIELQVGGASDQLTLALDVE